MNYLKSRTIWFSVLIAVGGSEGFKNRPRKAKEFNSVITW
jgi:hypothetical protein